jgi:hypothetical protein
VSACASRRATVNITITNTQDSDQLIDDLTLELDKTTQPNNLTEQPNLTS